LDRLNRGSWSGWLGVPRNRERKDRRTAWVRAKMGVPFIDLRRQYETIRTEATAAVIEVCESQQFVLGRNVAALESSLSEYCGVRHAIGVSSGTDALLATMMALGVGPGDEIIAPSFTFVATANTVARLGARVVFADIEDGTYNIDAAHVSRLIGRRTKGIVAVHIFGQCASLGALAQLAGTQRIWILEDCAQAIGASQGGRRAGSTGIAGCFSFYPTKNLGAFGDGGFITTQDDGLAERLRAIRSHGGVVRYQHDCIGGCFRLDEIQAAVLRVKLPRLNGWTEQRRQLAAGYDAAFASSGLVDSGAIRLPTVGADNHHVYNQYVIRARSRDDLRKYLVAGEIGTDIYYPRPLHLQPCFADLGYGVGSLPHTEAACREVLALPCFPELTASEQQEVVAAIVAFYRAR
jgi:dTDP-4-amino-4,6-dideoxygalactose transaminase